MRKKRTKRKVYCIESSGCKGVSKCNSQTLKFVNKTIYHDQFKGERREIPAIKSLDRTFCLGIFVFLGRDVRKPVNTNPGLKVNRSINFSCIKILFTTNVLRSLSLVKTKTEGQTLQTESLTQKLQN